ncbi:LuxR C-terminal-related transcriptional regulator [Streptomyces sp. NPDC091292]|uniref:LuxR C-terminal-related transcriptional regulator n=1 Tax=Streptomyces sp. NPDC091292 TaxID=3365991 RepID=UPI0038015EF2
MRHVGDKYGREVSLRRVACRRDEARVEHSALRRLLTSPHTSPHGSPHGEPLPAHQIAVAARELVDGLLTRGPLVIAIGDAQWCDDGTLRCIDRVLREAAGEPLTVLLSLSPGLLAVAAAGFHGLLARDYCSVVDTADLWPADTPRPAAGSLDDLGRREPGLLRVAQAAALLGTCDADLVGALAGFPSGVAGQLLESARGLGLVPGPVPAQGGAPHLETLLDALPGAGDERMRAQAAEILNDAARPAGQVADLLLGQSTLDRPWMRTILKEAATAARLDRPASAVSYLTRLHEADPDDAAVRTDLATVLLDIDPTAAGTHLRGALSRTDDPPTRARATGPLRLTALMTHRSPDTPDALGALLHELDPGRPEDLPGDRSRPAQVGASPVPGGDPTEHLVLAARALRTALTGTDTRAAVVDARHVLRSYRPPHAWARVASARVLALADDTTTALDQLRRTVADSQRREEVWAERHAGAALALLLLESGRAADAADAALAASHLTGGRSGQPGQRAGRPGQDWAGRTRLAPIALALALVARADLDRAEDVLRRVDGHRLEGCVWEYHHHLTACALVAHGRGRAEHALALLERCGASLAAAGVRNPVFTTWWVHSTYLLMELGRVSAATERAELGRELAERWPTARSTGLSLLARGLVATAADRVELLTESVRVLADSSDRYAHALAELRLGTALLRLGDEKAARNRLHAARATAVQGGLTIVAEQARIALGAAGGRPARAALSDAERRVAEMAAAGATNQAISDALCLTVRTVEYHLTKVYRKLGLAGRAELAHRVSSRGWLPSGCVPGEAR